jgi:hypothetical protein
LCAMDQGNTDAKTRLASVSRRSSAFRVAPTFAECRRNTKLAATTIHDAATNGFVSGSASAGSAHFSTSAGACVAARQWNVSA